MSRKTRRRSRRGPVLVLVTLLLAAGAFVLWTRSGDAAPAAADTTPTPTTASVPASEPAPSESAATEPETSADADGDADAEGDETAEEESGGTAPEVAVPSAPTASPEREDVAAPAPVEVSLTYSGYDPSSSAVVAGGYASDVVEVDATCTLVLRRDGVELRGESLGTPSANSTDCGEVRVGGTALTSGTWEAVLSYTSETSVGQSPAGEVVVP